MLKIFLLYLYLRDIYQISNKAEKDAVSIDSKSKNSLRFREHLKAKEQKNLEEQRRVAVMVSGRKIQLHIKIQGCLC